MAADERPVPQFDLVHADEINQFLVRDPYEIAFVIRQLATKRSLVTAHFGDSAQSLLTTVLAVGKADIHVEASAVEAVTIAATRAASMLCTTQLDQVKIQFRLGPCERATWEGADAIKAQLPDAMLRLQRRENFRLATTLGPALTCRFLIDEKKSVEARVLDLSIGGLALAVPPRVVTLNPGMELSECRILLTGIGPVVVNLRVRSVFMISTHTGDVQRAGCQFINLSPEIRNSVQLYINDIERKRRASRDA